ncbi:glycosyltransferase family 2 protein [Pseudomonas sp. dw_358]|uniref:glycosyltransferase family 2 protein n=1 Tax=Pseudomonas sp. dw_358 TaxID=2720083 RepID=UPI001BD64F4C|nr:glycosyltransferase family 2 protein [Pseudomonas sp. dw_358]
MISHDKVCAFVLNWNGADQTIACMDSLKLHCDIPVVIIDNGSKDDSVARLTAYLNAESGEDVLVASEDQIKSISQKHKRTLISNNGNYGYAGGNNIGLEYALRAGYEYFWILNNDIVLEDGALEALLTTMEEDPKCGFAASVLVYENNPNIIQCVGGGTIYPWLGKTKLIGKNANRSELTPGLPTFPKPDYVMGASMLISRAVLETVGLMEDRYFMYSEELDWQYRGAKAGFSFKVSEHSFARHGDSGSSKGRSHMFHYYRNRAAIMYNKKFHSTPVWLMSALTLTAITILQNRKSPKNIRYGIKGVAEGLSFSW